MATASAVGTHEKKSNNNSLVIYAIDVSEHNLF